tara:strand:- start:234 stop:2615 length:2382 start_codon:yes stop_codon:yes gene_type:complete
MKIAESWLREWVNPDLNTENLGYQLTMLGHEINDILVEGHDIGDLIVAEVVSVSKHPNADKLNLCEVDDGNGKLIEVVCGAPNVTQGMKAVLIKPGSMLPSGIKIKKTKIRGITSNGMLCSESEIGLAGNSDGIISLPSEAKVGSKIHDILGLPDSTFDLDLTPNRGDCFSVLGIARDLAAVTSTRLKNYENTKKPPISIDETYPVELIEPNVCPRFTGRVIRGINIKAKTPLWMSERLRRSGLRSISPIVDITNYVMLELGQPLHAYDLNMLKGPIKPRISKKNESVQLLDEKTVTLDNNTIVISDDTGPIGIAGIMGGLRTAVTSETTDIFLESAFFPQHLILGRARKYGMHTDASIRFERGVDPSIQSIAIEKASCLLVEITGGLIGPLSDQSYDELLPNQLKINLKKDQIYKILGIKINNEEIEKILINLNMKITPSSEGWSVSPPKYRFDISIESDLIEEIARIHGYDSIPSIDYSSKNSLNTLTESKIDLETISTTLVSRDYREILTYSFISPHLNKQFSGIESKLVLNNPISSEMSVMRSSLWPSLLTSALSNIARQHERIRFFEISKSFHGNISEPKEVLRIAGLVAGLREPEQWGNKTEIVDFYDIKSDVQALLSLCCKDDEISFLPSKHISLQPGQSAEIFRNKESIGFMGKLHPKIIKEFNLKKDIYLFELDAEKTIKSNLPIAKSISKFPTIRRDIAIIVNENITADNLIEVATASAPKFIRNIYIFDVYRGQGIEKGRKSIAMGLILQETSRTLTDEDADQTVSLVLKNLQNQFKVEIRD